LTVMNAREVAEYLRCNYRHALWLLSTGQITSWRMCNQWRTSREYVDRFLLSGGEQLHKAAVERVDANPRKRGRPRKTPAPAACTSP